MADILFNQIMAWGDVSVPENWQVCDGTNGTPDLRGMFIYGASTNDQLNTSGGASTHGHTCPDSSVGGTAHSHSFSISTSSAGGNSRASASEKFAYGGHSHSYSGETNLAYEYAHVHTSTLATATALPPCILLYYIMRMV